MGKISSYDAVVTPADTDETIVVQGGVNLRETREQMTSACVKIADLTVTTGASIEGENTGDEDKTSILSKLEITTLSGDNTGDQDLSGLIKKDQTTPDTLVGLFHFPTAKIGGATDNTEFEADGTMKMNGDASVWDDLRITPTAFDFLGNSDPTLVSYQPGGSGTSTKLYEFAKGDIAYFVVQLPHKYKVGTDIGVHIHWTPGRSGTAETGNLVGWKVQYSWANIGEAFVAMQTADLSDACDGMDLHQMTPSVTIDGHTAAKGISSMLTCQIERTDTGTDDTWAETGSGQLPMLLEVDFHYEIDTIGSRTATTK